LVYIPGPASAVTSILPQRVFALFDRKGGVEPLKIPEDEYEAPRVSPDGKLLAFGTGGKEAMVSIYDLSGASAPRRLTVGGNNRFPVWSANGDRVAFQSDREGDLGIFWQRADGSGTAERLTRADQGTAHAPESWSPGGDGFLFSITKDRTVTLWYFSLKDKKAEPFGGVQSVIPTHAVFSPDGRWVAYNSAGTDVGGLWVQPFPATGAKYELISRAGGHLVWSPSGKEILYARSAVTFTSRSITTQPAFVFGNEVQIPIGPLSRQAPTFPRTFDIVPDGRILGLIAAADTRSDHAPTGPSTGPRIHVVLNWFTELQQRVPTR
jgi:Tol biopolymer transport system component